MIYSFFIISKAGGLIYSLDLQPPSKEKEIVSKYPLELVLEEGDRGVCVKFGEDPANGIEGNIAARKGQNYVKTTL